VATHLENMDKSGNLRVVRETSGQVCSCIWSITRSIDLDTKCAKRHGQTDCRKSHRKFWTCMECREKSGNLIMTGDRFTFMCNWWEIKTRQSILLIVCDMPFKIFAKVSWLEAENINLKAGTVFW